MAYRLLLADDSITIQKVVGIIFSNEDYELAIVDNGTAAVDKAKEIIPDLMLVDAIMPGKNGYEVCEEVRRDPRLAAVPILLLTGVFEPFDEEKATRSGADDYISKPFESQHLLDKVKSLVELGRSRTAAVSPAVQEPAFAAPSFGEVILPADEPTDEYAGEPAARSPWDVVTPQEDFFESPVAESEPFAVEKEEPVGIVIEELSAFEDHADVVPLTAADQAEPPASDDLWGALDLEEPVEEADFGIVSDEKPEVSVFAASSFAAPEPAGFENPWGDEEPFSASLPSEAPGGNAWEESPVGSGWDEQEPSELSAALSEPAVSAPAWNVQEEVEEVPPFAAFDEEPADEETFAPIADFAGQEAFGIPAEEPVFAPEEEYVPAPELAAAAAPAAEGMQGSATVTLSEEQLAAVVAKISKEVIERIAWEVVPDLAEALIKDEIRKITGMR